MSDSSPLKDLKEVATPAITVPSRDINRWGYRGEREIYSENRVKSTPGDQALEALVRGPFPGPSSSPRRWEDTWKIGRKRANGQDCIFDRSKCSGKERWASPPFPTGRWISRVSSLWSFIHAHNLFGSVFGKLLLFSALNCLNCCGFVAFKKKFGKRHEERLTVKCLSGENLHRFMDSVLSCKYWIWRPRKQMRSHWFFTCPQIASNRNNNHGCEFLSSHNMLSTKDFTSNSKDKVKESMILLLATPWLLGLDLYAHSQCSVKPAQPS